MDKMVSITLTEVQARNLIEFLNRVPLNTSSNNGIVEANEFIAIVNAITSSLEKGGAQVKNDKKNNS